MAEGVFIPTKNAFGQIPVADVEWSEPDKVPSADSLAVSLAAPILHFVPTDAFDDAVNTRQRNLIDFVSILENFAGDAITVSRERVMGAARGFGPLFGADQAESVIDWLRAASTAFSAVRIQEVVNGFCDIGLLRTVPMEKMGFEDGRGMRFDLFSLALNATGAYRRLIGNPRFWNVCHHARWYDYCFTFSRSLEDDSLDVMCYLARFRHAISCDEYLGLCSTLKLDQASVESGARFFDYEMDRIQESSLSPSSMFHEIPTSITEGDLDALETLVKFLASIHCRGASIDFVSVDEGTGFLSFDSYLSWLWYDFTMRRSDVRVGYCEECGRAFSLVGHRGLERRYCSRTCKTKAHNDENRRKRDAVRHGFIDGLSVGVLAQDVLGKDDAENRRIVREMLENWPHLKHLVNDAAEGRDMVAWACEDVVRRCHAEGVDLRRLMSKALKSRFLSGEMSER